MSDDNGRSRSTSLTSTGSDGSLLDRLLALPRRLRRGMDRREFLRAVASAGYSLGIARLLGVEDFLAAEDGQLPIVTARTRAPAGSDWRTTERTTTVPAEWYAAVSKAFEIHSSIADTGITGYLGSAVEPGEYPDASATITVDASAEDIDRVEGELGDVVEEVAIDVRPIEGVEEFEAEIDEDVDPLLAESVDDGRIPGGVRCQNETTMATLAPALYDPDGEQRLFATASHAYQDYDEIEGAHLSLPLAEGDVVDLGKVRDDHAGADVVTVEPDGEYEPESAVREEQERRVIGHYTRIGLAHLAARGEDLEKVGAQTRHTTGSIGGIDAVTCLTADYCRRGQLKWGDEADFTDGDSGSVCYHHDPAAPDERVIVAAFNNARTWWPGQSYIWGTAAYRLANEHGYHF